MTPHLDVIQNECFWCGGKNTSLKIKEYWFCNQTCWNEVIKACSPESEKEIRKIRMKLYTALAKLGLIMEEG